MASPYLAEIDKTPWPVALTEVKPETLHQDWPFIKKGLTAVLAKVTPDWRDEDIYTALATGASNCVMARRGGRDIGFVVYYKLARPFSKKPDLFIWAAYTIPFKERLPSDNVPDLVATVWRYLCLVAKSNFGTSVIVFITTAKRAEAFKRKYRWLPRYVTFMVEI